MPTVILPPSVLPALLSLQEMLQGFWFQDLPDEEIPPAFWAIKHDDIFYDALQYLPCCLFTEGGPSGRGHSYEDIASLPEGFWLATIMFELEEGFDNEGWIAISNMEEEPLRWVVQAYLRIGLTQRAAALERVIAAYIADPYDPDGYAKAADGQLPDLRDDEAAVSKVIAFFRADPDTLFGKIA